MITITVDNAAGDENIVIDHHLQQQERKKKKKKRATTTKNTKIVGVDPSRQSDSSLEECKAKKKKSKQKEHDTKNKKTNLKNVCIIIIDRLVFFSNFVG
jgi:hypothetical protein